MILYYNYRDKERSDILESFEHIEYFVEDLDHASGIISINNYCLTNSCVDLIPLNGVDVIVKYLYSNDKYVMIKWLMNEWMI